MQDSTPDNDLNREIKRARLALLKTQIAGVEKKTPWYRAINWTIVIPLVTAIIAAAATVIGGLAIESARRDREIELARFARESDLIIEAAKAPPDRALANLEWLLETELITDPEDKIKHQISERRGFVVTSGEDLTLQLALRRLQARHVAPEAFCLERAAEELIAAQVVSQVAVTTCAATNVPILGAVSDFTYYAILENKGDTAVTVTLPVKQWGSSVLQSGASEMVAWRPPEGSGSPARTDDVLFWVDGAPRRGTFILPQQIELRTSP